MSALSLFVIEILACLVISLFVIFLLTPVLRGVLVDGCGTAARADFWVTFTQLMLVVSPLLLVIYFAPTGQDRVVDIVAAIKDTLFLSLLGDFIALAMIGRVMWKSVSADLDKQQAETETQVNADTVELA